MFEIVYFFLLFVLLFWLTTKLPFFQINSFNKWIISTSFIIKVFVGIFVTYYFLNVGFNTNEPSDTFRFIKEGKELNQVFYKSKSDYFSMLLNIGDQRLLAQKHLSSNFLWRGKGLKLINDSRNLIRINSLINFISFRYLSIHILIFSFLSFIGFTLIFKAITKVTLLKPIHVFLFLFLFPSMLFWSSSLLKEPLMLLGIGLLLYSLFSNFSFSKKSFLTITSFGILLAFKPYILICLIPSLLFYFFTKYIFKDRLTLSVFSGITILIIPFFIISQTRIKITNYLTTKQFQSKHIGLGGLHLKADTCFYFFRKENYSNLKLNLKDTSAILIKPSIAQYRSIRNKFPAKNVFLYPNGKNWKIKLNTEGANTYFYTTPIDFKSYNLIYNLPEALFNSYFRPFPNEKGGILKIISILETLGISLLIIYSIKNRRKLNTNQKAVLIGFLLFAFSLFLLIGWTSCVSGEIIRYRFPAQLAIILSTFILMKSKKKIEE